jgi:IS1 family transposase
MSRCKIQAFLLDWLGLELGKATINRCIHELGLASEPVVEDLIEEVQAADIVHVDETPWFQRKALCWLWVVVTAQTVVYRIGDRSRATLVSLIGDAFMGWLVTDGYTAYRHHAHRQRCLAHLIRKALALAEGHYPASASKFGQDLLRDLRRLIQRYRVVCQVGSASEPSKRRDGKPLIVQANCRPPGQARVKAGLRPPPSAASALTHACRGPV